MKTVNTYTVITRELGQITVRASSVRVRSGMLRFRRNGKVVGAFKEYVGFRQERA